MTKKMKNNRTTVATSSHFFYEHVKHKWKLTVFKKCEQCQPKLRSSWGTFCISFKVHFRMLRHADRLVAKILAIDIDLGNCTLKETRRAAFLEWLSRLGLKR